MDRELIDKAWRCLPREFKEEVKRKFQLTDADCIAYEILIDLFGLHNLTSDTEGEEILTVSRKNVQRMYSYNEEEITKDPTNKGALLLKLRLDALFGSKCLPDELNEDNFAKSEPKPAEPKKKRHVSVKEACEILGVDESEATTLVKSKPIETCTDYCSSPDHFVVKDEMVDNIIKDGFREHNRLHIAAILAAGMLASEVRCYPVDRALELADALIAECEKGDNNA